MHYDQLSTMIARQAEHYGERTCLKYKNYDTNTWVPVSWNQVSENVRIEAQALAALGVVEQEKVGVFSQNMPECVYTEFASFVNRAVNVPIYATSSTSQLKFIVEDAEIRVLFVGEQAQYETALDVISHCDCLKHIICFDPKIKKSPKDQGVSMDYKEFLKMADKEGMQELVEQRTAAFEIEDLACLLYTSGTTGTPKGVRLTHLCFEQAFRDHDDRLDVTDQDVSVGFLPMTHIFEKAWVYYCLHCGVTTYINLRPQEILQTLKEVRPTMMCSVPRFWEKVYSGVEEKIRETTGLQKTLMTDAIKVGMKHNCSYVREGKRPPMWLRAKYAFYEKTVYKMLKKALGLENGRLFPVAGAKFAESVHDFTTAVGMPIYLGYGLTETTATVSVNDPWVYKRGSVGKPFASLQVKIGENNEILLKGNSVTPGYYNCTDANEQAIDKDGWFHTGDAGYMDEEGNLYLTERIKELFKTSNGKYIAPQNIETSLVVDRYIDQIVIVADQRKFVSALIVPDFTQLELWAQTQNPLANVSREELVKREDVIALFAERIETLQQHFANFEKVKKFTLLTKGFSLELGEVTNTLKVKRNVVYKHYSEMIEAMYKG